MSCLHQIAWSHVILEDAYHAQSTSSKTARALAALEVTGETWWVDTGAHCFKRGTLSKLVTRFHHYTGGVTDDEIDNRAAPVFFV